MIDRMRSWSRRKKVLTGTAAVVVMIAGAGVVYALLTVRAPIGGSGSVKATPPNLTVTAVEVLNPPADGSCAVTQPNQVSMPNKGAGEHCDFRFSVSNQGGNVPLQLQSIDFSSTTTETFISPTTCGMPIPANGTLMVSARFTIPASTPPGPFTASATAGITGADAEAFSPANCPT